MKVDINSFMLSLEFSIIVLSLFSIIYLSSFNWQKNKWVIVALISIGWTFFNILIGEDRYHLIGRSNFLQNPAPLLLFFPALYFYTLSLVKPNEVGQKRQVLHFIPFVFCYFLFAVIGFKAPNKMPTELSSFVCFFISLPLIGLLYGYFILNLVQDNQKKYQDKFSNSDTFITLKWMKWMIWILISLPIIGGLFPLALSFLTGIDNKVFTLITLLLSIGSLSFFTFRQPTLYIEEEYLPKSKKKPTSTSKLNPLTNNSSLLEEEEKNKLIAQLEAYIQEKEPFLNATIRMPELAKAVDIPRHIFSQLINEHYQMNFFHFINQYRIEYAKKLLIEKENQHYTLESIGQMAGFNSKSTFNTRFKEIVGKSPKVYQQEFA